MSRSATARAVQSGSPQHSDAYHRHLLVSIRHNPVREIGYALYRAGWGRESLGGGLLLHTLC